MIPIPTAEKNPVLTELGYKSTTAQLLSVPPYVAASILTVGMGFIGDKTSQRGICLMAVSPLSVIGFGLLLSDIPVGVKYAATFLAAMGIYPCIPIAISWLTNNTEGIYKRGVTVGIAVGWGNIQGCVISNIYRSVDAPRFILGHAVVLGYLTIALLGGSILHYSLLRRENRLRREGRRDHWTEGKSSEEIWLMGDMR